MSIDKHRGCLVGLAVGDAVGTTVEFSARGSFPPVTDMLGGGPFNLKAGQWTDDTSMALCLAQSLIDCRMFDERDQMLNYRKWMTEGYYSSTGVLFDIGMTTSTALSKFLDTNDPYAGDTSEMSSGNGSIMRLAPIPMFYVGNTLDTFIYSRHSSKTTHASRSCLDSCSLMGLILNGLLRGVDKKDVLDMYEEYTYLSKTFNEKYIEKKEIAEIAKGSYINKHIDDIVGSGYVIQSLEAALWCFHNTDNYKDAILEATNLGDDADTTAAICGQFAGAYYGMSGIPTEWVNKITMKDKIIELADKLYK
jgi:ADP-ribosyl-[dinitrogen reductase] hydrolase